MRGIHLVYIYNRALNTVSKKSSSKLPAENYTAQYTVAAEITTPREEACWPEKRRRHRWRTWLASEEAAAGALDVRCARAVSLAR